MQTIFKQEIISRFIPQCLCHTDRYDLMYTDRCLSFKNFDFFHIYNVTSTRARTRTPSARSGRFIQTGIIIHYIYHMTMRLRVI